jgi:hypothetical protein
MQENDPLPGFDPFQPVVEFVIGGLEKIHPRSGTLFILGAAILGLGIQFEGSTGFLLALMLCATYPIVRFALELRIKTGPRQETFWLYLGLGTVILGLGILSGDLGLTLALILCITYPIVRFFLMLRRKMGPAQKTMWLYLLVIPTILLWLIAANFFFLSNAGVSGIDSWALQAPWKFPAPWELALITGGASGLFLASALRRCPTFLSQVVVVGAYLVAIPFALVLVVFFGEQGYPSDGFFIGLFSALAVPVLMIGTYVGWSVRVTGRTVRWL